MDYSLTFAVWFNSGVKKEVSRFCFHEKLFFSAVDWTVNSVWHEQFIFFIVFYSLYSVFFVSLLTYSKITLFFRAQITENNFVLFFCGVAPFQLLTHYFSLSRWWIFFSLRHFLLLFFIFFLLSTILFLATITFITQNAST